MRVDKELLSIGYADLVENACHVVPDRAVTDRQLVGDIFVRESLLHQANNLAFPLGQGFGPRSLRWVGFHLPREGELEAYLSRGLPLRSGGGLRGGIQRLDHRKYDFRRLYLQDDAVDAGGKCLARAVLVPEPAQQYDLTARDGFPNLLNDADGVALGLQIQNEHIGAALGEEPVGGSLLVREHNHRDGCAALENFLQAQPHETLAA